MTDHIEAFKRNLDTLVHHSQSARHYREAIMPFIREAVPFAAACCTSVDPITLLSTGSSTDDAIEAIHHRLFEYEYGHGHEDFNSYERLIHAPLPVGSLYAATDGQLLLSGRYREVLAPAGFGDELRAVFIHDGACWGYLTLFRRIGDPLFREEECLFIASIAPLLAKSIKTAALKPAASNRRAEEQDAGMLILTDHLELESSNAASSLWLNELRTMEGIGSSILPRPLRAVGSRALGQTADSSSEAKVCILMPDGSYLAIKAFKLEGASRLVKLGVTIEQAKPADVLPLIAQAYSLSAREIEVIERIIKGFSTKEIAFSLHISAYTVQDHLKSIFTKMGVNSRRELLWELVAKHS
ncbi:helix-turn-helix transcriptional regulator [Paenibacillus sinopodophylli]|uniref:helix-turn-helix transcriptional regulator n=1 Tax=Paenibacillus sinopodophylli TaxID=1837342 RepID=UPI00110D02C3|nr:LuxR family transcriptional regulator [Paenibacillus sinopodophylli]